MSCCGNTYDLGTTVYVQASFVDVLDGNIPVTPATVTFKTMDPLGNEVTYSSGEITNVTQGVYFVNVIATSWGKWRYRWEASGNMTVTQDGFFNVAYSPLSS